MEVIPVLLSREVRTAFNSPLTFHRPISSARGASSYLGEYYRRRRPPIGTTRIRIGLRPNMASTPYRLLDIRMIVKIRPYKRLPVKDAILAEMQNNRTDLPLEERSVTQCVGCTVNTNKVSSQVEILLQSSLSRVIEDWCMSLVRQ